MIDMKLGKDYSNTCRDGRTPLEGVQYTGIYTSIYTKYFTCAINCRFHRDLQDLM